MNHELIDGPLLDDNGDLLEAGYATSLVKTYDRNKIKAGKSRIKEWDYYYVGNKDYGIALTIADNSYMSLISVSYLDFQNKINITKSVMKFFTFGKLSLPFTSKTGDLSYKNKKIDISFKHENGKRHLTLHFKKFSRKEDLRADIYLEETNRDSMVIATPFKKKAHFYYNQKINLLRSSGYMKLGDKLIDLSVNTYGVLDWGRGVWTYSNTWYWSSLNSTYQGKRIGFNLGYGFGDTSAASENMFFYEDRSYKLGDVHFDIPISKFGRDDYLKEWKFRSDSGDVNLTFTPVMNRHANMNVIFIKSLQNQVFGLFSGYFVIEGKEVYFENLPGFAEKVHNAW